MKQNIYDYSKQFMQNCRLNMLLFYESALSCALNYLRTEHKQAHGDTGAEKL